MEGKDWKSIIIQLFCINLGKFVDLIKTATKYQNMTLKILL